MEQEAAKCDSGRDDCDAYVMGIPKAWLLDFLFDKQFEYVPYMCERI